MNIELATPAILTAICMAGGTMKTRQLYAAVEPLLLCCISDQERVPYRNQQIPWQVKICGYKAELSKRRLIDRNSPKGQWKITPLGERCVDMSLMAIDVATAG